MVKGIKIKEVKLGDGPAAVKGKVVVVHYDCYLNRGDKVHSSRGKCPLQFEVGQRMQCVGLEHGVVEMRPGGLRSVRVSPHLTYYERQTIPCIPEGAVLRYEIELLGVTDEWDNHWMTKYGAA